MKFTPIDPPREFRVGLRTAITMKDCARISLEPDEQVTFMTEAGGEYDVARKSWGFYATPSLNQRLPYFGLRAALGRSTDGKYYVFLVEHGRENVFTQYLELEHVTLVSWLDRDETLRLVERALKKTEQTAGSTFVCVCGGMEFELSFRYNAPPPGEISFRFTSGMPYRREILRCKRCGHFLSTYDIDEAALYSGDYIDANYGEGGIRAAFERINALDPEKSDNVRRVRRISDFIASHRTSDPQEQLLVLDVGSGLGVFIHRMKAAGWDGTAVDPDPRAAAFARDTVGVKAVKGDFLNTAELGEFDLIAFNRVLEHVEQPSRMLVKAREFLKPTGFVYIEVPDGEGAFAAGPNREEFFIDHLHVFSAASVAHLAANTGYSLVELRRVREPSGKYTIYAFLALSSQAATAP